MSIDSTNLVTPVRWADVTDDDSSRRLERKNAMTPSQIKALFLAKPPLHFDPSPSPIICNPDSKI